MPTRFADAERALRDHALAKPEATEHFPWGERAIKVKGKVFLFMFADATRLSLSTKLPDSSGIALMLPFAKPTGYGLGKAGWVSAAFEPGEPPPVEMLCNWIDESYRAVAPAKLAALAAATASTKPPAKKPAAKKPAAKKPPAKKPAAKKPPAKKPPAKKPPAKKPPARKPPARKPPAKKPPAKR
ncbi:MAG TPA: MmcQ/YjbR family DNA-binding protein [Kofleriaceae bacterium]|nr:MmcQ/YjbR family DNA-binding protein [Kofleriaceae bacterium]